MKIKFDSAVLIHNGIEESIRIKLRNIYVLALEINSALINVMFDLVVIIEPKNKINLLQWFNIENPP